MIHGGSFSSKHPQPEEPSKNKNKNEDTTKMKRDAYSFMPVALETRRLWRTLRSSMISSDPPGMA